MNEETRSKKKMSAVGIEHGLFGYEFGALPDLTDDRFVFLGMAQNRILLLRRITNLVMTHCCEEYENKQKDCH